MKKALVMMLAVLCLVLTLVGCGGKTAVCDFCNEEKVCTETEVLGQKLNICDDCKGQIEDLANMFN